MKKVKSALSSHSCTVEVRFSHMSRQRSSCAANEVVPKLKVADKALYFTSMQHKVSTGWVRQLRHLEDFRQS